MLRSVATSTSSRSSVSELSTKRLTSNLNDIIYYFLMLIRLFQKNPKNILQFSQSIISANNSILYIEGEKCMICPKVQFVARGRSPRATKH
jgi:hypothetical protein